MVQVLRVVLVQKRLLPWPGYPQRVEPMSVERLALAVLKAPLQLVQEQKWQV